MMRWVIEASSSSKGFALPTILISSVVMLVILVAATASSVSMSTMINEQHYQKLAETAAESGFAVAQSCLEASNNVVTWSDVNPLRPNTNCAGIPLVACPETSRDSRCGVLNNDSVRTTYEIKATTSDSDGHASVLARGSVDLLRSGTSEVWSSYSHAKKLELGAVRRWVVTTQFASGYYNTVMILGDGQAYGVGQNNHGQMAQGDFNPVPKFSKYQLENAQGRFSTGPLSASAVVANWGSVLILASDGQVYGAGSQAAGSLGDGVLAPGYTTIDDFPSSYRTAVPVRYRLPADWNAKRIIPTSAGVAYVLAAPSSNPNDVQLFGAGRNDQGNLGDGTFVNQATPVQFNVDGAVGRTSTGHLSIKSVDNFSPSGRVNQRTHTCVVASDEAAYCVGREDFGQFGIGTSVSTRHSVPQRAPLPSGVKAKDVFLTDGVTFVLGTDNQLYSAGRNAWGILGDGTTTSRSSFAKVRLDLAVGRTSSNLTVEKVAVLADSLHVLASDGNVYSSGVNDNGRFGNGTTNNSAFLTKMNAPLIPGEKIVELKTSGSKTNSRSVYLLTSNGRVMVVGDNAYGQIGDGTTTGRSTPYAWPSPDGSKAIDIQPSTYTDLGTLHVVMASGRIYATGANQAYQIGDGTNTDRWSPERMDLSLPIPRLQLRY